MAIINIYDKDTNTRYTVTVNLVSNFTNTDAAATQEGQGYEEYYITIDTTIPDPDGNRYDTFYIKTLSDVPTGFPTASDFDELVRYYIEYFQGLVIYASSSSSESSSSSSSSSQSN
jgi:hypothetical protein